MSYIRANEFVLQNETIQFVYAHAHELGYTDDQTEELLAAFDRDFLRKIQTLAEKDSTVYNDLQSFINGEAYGYNIHFCLLRYHK